VDYAPDDLSPEAELLKMLEMSPEYRVLEQRIAESQASLDVARAEAWPDLEVGGGVQQFSESDDHAYFFELSVPFPLFDRNQGAIAEASASLEGLKKEREARVLEMHADLQNVLRKYASVREASQAMDMTVMPAARTSYESMQKAYQTGGIDILALLDAQRTWVEARDTQLELIAELQRTRIELNRLITSHLTPEVSSFSTMTDEQ
jgi:cobalt-zinc-cadmium efflux system outer membrane protein